MRSRILLILTLFLTSCLDEIDLQPNRGFDETIVVDGKLVKGTPSYVSIVVNRLFDFAPGSRKTIRVAEIVIRDEEGNELPLRLSGDERYSVVIPDDHPTFKVDYYKKYLISLRTSDGRRYESNLEELRPVPKMEKIAYQAASKLVEDKILGYATRTFVEFFVDFELPEAGDGSHTSLRWEFERTWAVHDNPPPSLPSSRKVCYITEITGSYDFTLFDASVVRNTDLEDFLVYDTNVDHQFAEGYVLHVYQESMAPTARDYWNEVKAASIRRGDMFEPAPGKIRTNFRNLDQEKDDRIAGFFYATEIDTIRTFVPPEYLGYPDTLCIPLPTPEYLVEPHICLDCLVEPRSTTEVPHFWPR